MHKDPAGESIIVVPSITIEHRDPNPTELQAYEERFLFLLFLLRKPRLRMIYVTSQPIDPEIIDYYLQLLPGVIASHAHKRLFLVSAFDASPRPLTDKLLERPLLIERIRALIPDPDTSHMIPYNTTELERELAVRLGVPMYAADPELLHLGTKTGSRKLFAEEGVAVPLGYEDLGSLEEVALAIAKMRAEKPSMPEVLLKLNQGVSGEGNALVDLSHVAPPGHPDEMAGIKTALDRMSFELEGTPWNTYVAKLQQRRGVVEERIRGNEFRSPSVQLRVTPLGDVELLSTHDQLLGGPSGQSYLGCVFPADCAYATLITTQAAKIGARLANEGVIGRFAIDFVVVRTTKGWDCYAIEINLRKGGTTHPFLTLQFLTDGSYNSESGLYSTPVGINKFFVASDHVESPNYRGLNTEALFDIAVRHRIHFDHTRETGVVFHMMSALSELGRVGFTAVGDTAAQAQDLFDSVVVILDEEARVAVSKPELPRI